MSVLRKETIEKYNAATKKMGSVCRIEDELMNGDKAEQGHERSWRIFKIMAEFVEGFELLKKFGLAATFFGSARSKEGEASYQMATELAGRLSDDGFAIITGGGGGIMGAANKGAYQNGGYSIGLNIELPAEQRPNEYITHLKSFHYFFIRKVMLSYASEVYIFMPGGFGTLDELFEIVTLIQTKKIAGIPVVLVGKEYWSPLLLWMDEALNKKGNYINPEDMKIYHLVDSVDEAHELIRELVLNK